MVTMHKTNFLNALHLAIEDRRKVEKGMGYTGDSIFVAGLLEIKEQVQAQGDGTVYLELKG